MFLKNQTIDYHPKKALVFEKEEIIKFLKEATDDKYLFIKVNAIICENFVIFVRLLFSQVVIIIGICGGCRGNELHNMRVDDFEDRGNVIVVRLPVTKTHIQRSFSILNDWNGIDLYKKYVAMRPADVPHDKFFVNFQKGKCTKQPVGIHKLESVPKQVAEYLCLPNPNLYTGHTLRRTSATLLANSGASDVTMKIHGGWSSSSVVSGYIADSVNQKIAIAKMISGGGSSSASDVQVMEGTTIVAKGVESAVATGGNTFSFNDCSFKNCHFN